MDYKDNVIVEKSFNFAKRMVGLRRSLIADENEYVLSNQVLKSGTSIGANVFEAQNAQSNADFLSKMKIALKEATETLYWLMLLYETDYISKKAFDSLNADLEDIRNILGSICRTTQNNL